MAWMPGLSESKLCEAAAGHTSGRELDPKLAVQSQQGNHGPETALFFRETLSSNATGAGGPQSSAASRKMGFVRPCQAKHCAPPSSPLLSWREARNHDGWCRQEGRPSSRTRHTEGPFDACSLTFRIRLKAPPTAKKMRDPRRGLSKPPKPRCSEPPRREVQLAPSLAHILPLLPGDIFVATMQLLAHVCASIGALCTIRRSRHIPAPVAGQHQSVSVSFRWTGINPTRSTPLKVNRNDAVYHILALSASAPEQHNEARARFAAHKPRERFAMSRFWRVLVRARARADQVMTRRSLCPTEQNMRHRPQSQKRTRPEAHDGGFADCSPFEGAPPPATRQFRELRYSHFESTRECVLEWRRGLWVLRNASWSSPFHFISSMIRGGHVKVCSP